MSGGIRSRYLFESNFCTPYEAHEKRQVENLVGYSRRNWFVPLPKVKDFEDLTPSITWSAADAASL
ncbi:MAG: hypothetical protein HYX78_13990 [Armatimonadetes bacterium]|nr:hypothetical protein [Armatimonadota bacterium]